MSETATETRVDRLKRFDPCPVCGPAHPLTVSGALYQPDPRGPILPEPVVLFRCWNCRQTFRADRVDYDEMAVREAWRGCREREDGP